ncbi:hypothetical protein M413DRAFT_59608 [Hebeloma cylindrosporum]|uniref:Non-specific serine/threonine protein kinase n=1 Tax=Hebeloma cylindrosporum TaxID=76867 RepID=A0A0C3CKE8_HEBCY|nr:hypothetical protein M413DRAFT_59608 [Hebeloma cylindrosporum h7]
MLLNEASIYEHLKPLQGQHIALVFAYLTSETADALFMEYMGCESNDMNSFTYSQRTSLWEELCAIHGMGVIHGDLRLANIVTLDGSDPHFIDFTHGSLHDCKGPAECDELTQAREFLLLLEDSDGKPQ